jgi:hypothetical protein
VVVGSCIQLVELGWLGITQCAREKLKARTAPRTEKGPLAIELLEVYAAKDFTRRKRGNRLYTIVGNFQRKNNRDDV